MMFASTVFPASDTSHEAPSSCVSGGFALTCREAWDAVARGFAASGPGYLDRTYYGFGIRKGATARGKTITAPGWLDMTAMVEAANVGVRLGPIPMQPTLILSRRGWAWHGLNLPDSP